jgi:hypothetical protein
MDILDMWLKNTKILYCIQENMRESELLTTWLHPIQLNNRLSTILYCSLCTAIGKIVSDSDPAFKSTTFALNCKKSWNLNSRGGPCINIEQGSWWKMRLVDAYVHCQCPCCLKTKKNANPGLIQDISRSRL